MAAKGAEAMLNAGQAINKDSTDGTPLNSAYQTSHPFNNFLQQWQGPVGQTTPGASVDKGIATMYPNIIERADPRDNKYAFGANITNGSGIIPGVGLKVATQADVDYFYKKSMDAKEAGFKAWLLQHIDVKDPVHQAYWVNKFPQVFQEKKDLILQQVRNQLKVAELNNTGPQTMEDYHFLYAVQSGEIKVSDKALWDPASVPTRAFNKGLLNVGRWWEPDVAKLTQWTNPVTGDAGANNAYSAPSAWFQ